MIVMAIAFVAVVLVMLVFPALLARRKKGVNDFDITKYMRYNDEKAGKSSRKSKSSPTKKNISGNRTTKTAKTKKSSRPRSKSKKAKVYTTSQ